MVHATNLTFLLLLLLFWNFVSSNRFQKIYSRTREKPCLYIVFIFIGRFQTFVFITLVAQDSHNIHIKNHICLASTPYFYYSFSRQLYTLLAQTKILTTFISETTSLLIHSLGSFVFSRQLYSSLRQTKILPIFISKPLWVNACTIYLGMTQQTWPNGYYASPYLPCFCFMLLIIVEFIAYKNHLFQVFATTDKKLKHKVGIICQFGIFFSTD